MLESLNTGPDSREELTHQSPLSDSPLAHAHFRFALSSSSPQPQKPDPVLTFGTGQQRPFAVLNPALQGMLAQLNAVSLRVEQIGSWEQVEILLARAVDHKPPAGHAPAGLTNVHFGQKVSYLGRIDPHTLTVTATAIDGIALDAKYGFVPLPRVKLREVALYPDNSAELSVERAGIVTTQKAALPDELAALIRSSLEDFAKLRLLP